jgi:hypothetical protein
VDRGCFVQMRLVVVMTVAVVVRLFSGLVDDRGFGGVRLKPKSESLQGVVLNALGRDHPALIFPPKQHGRLPWKCDGVEVTRPLFQTSR